MAYTKRMICATCGREVPPGRAACPICAPNPCGHVWDFRGLDGEKGGKKYFRYKCLRCGEERVEPVCDVRELYAGRLDSETGE